MKETLHKFYLPAYEDEKVIKRLQKFDDTRWELLFPTSCKQKEVRKNVTIFPIEATRFIKSMSHSKGVITAAGFSTTTEALYLNKKLLVVPQKSQFEQQYNGAVLKSMGVSLIKNLKKKQMPEIENWLNEGKTISVNYPDLTEDIVDRILGSNQPAHIYQPYLERKHPFELSF